MSKEITMAIVLVGLFAAVVLSIYFIMKFKSQMQPIQFDPNYRKEKSDWQKPGIVVLGTGIGTLIVGVLNSIPSININGVIVMGIIIISTGLGLIIAQKLDKKDSIEE